LAALAFAPPSLTFYVDRSDPGKCVSVIWQQNMDMKTNSSQSFKGQDRHPREEKASAGKPSLIEVNNVFPSASTASVRQARNHHW
jgi:hypothetical protein